MRHTPRTLAELYTSPGSEQTIASSLPDYAQPEQITLHMDTINRVAAWGGFYPNVEVLSWSGPATKQMGGFTESRIGGQRTATLTYAKPTVGYEYAAGDGQYRRRLPLKLWINTNELTQRVQNQPGGALRKPEAWAKQINDGVAAGLRDATYRHLMSRKPLPRDETLMGSFMAAASLAGGSILSTVEMSVHQRVDTSLVLGVVPAAIVGLIKALETVRDPHHSLRDFSFSLFPVWQVDRMVAVAGLTRALRFASVH